MTSLRSARAPIGVFDSGLGGLTVLKALHGLLPGEDFVYLGDTARLPYGNKSPQTILNYLEQNLRHFSRLGVKAVVVACNSASSVLAQLTPHPFPVFGVIEPGAARAKAVTASGRIGVLGTRATVSQKAYVKALAALDPKLAVFQQACPLLVPLVEEGWDEDPITNLIVFRYLNQLLEKGVDTLILGCTHYPILKPAIARVCGPHIHLVDSAEAIAHLVLRAVEDGAIPAQPDGHRGELRLYTTDCNETFEQIALRIMAPTPIPRLEQIDIT